METLHIILDGLSPLLMHNPISMTQTGGEKGLERKVIPTPKEDAAQSRYLLPDGNLYVEAIAVRNSMLAGAKGYRIGKLRAASVLAGAVILSDDAFPLFRNWRDEKPISGDDYTIDTRRAVVKGQGIMRSRAMIDLPWQLHCMFAYNSLLANLEQVKMAMDNAGEVVGLLDYRPACGGWFGRFVVIDIWSE